MVISTTATGILQRVYNSIAISYLNILATQLLLLEHIAS